MYSVKYDPGQINWNKMEKSSKTEQNKKILISIFAFFVTAIAKVYFPEESLDLGVSPS